MAIYCPSCGAENPDSAHYCNLCHADIYFEDDEYPLAVPKNDVYPDKYPSSFDADAPVVETDQGGSPSPVTPVDVGEYGVKSGHTVDEEPKPRKRRLRRG